MQKSQRGLCPLIFIWAVGVQTITAASRGGVIDWEMQVVPSKEPFEDSPGFRMPFFFFGNSIGFKTGRDHRLRFHRLLIEACPLAALRIKSIRADGHEMPALGICML